MQMISILLFCSLNLFSTICNAQQQTQLVYEQHYVENNNHQSSQNSHVNNYYQSPQQQQQQLVQQSYLPYQQSYNSNNQQQQQYPIYNHNVGPIPMFQSMPSANSPEQHQPSGGFMQRMGFAPGPFNNGMPPHEFSSRRGPPPPGHMKSRRGKPPPKRHGKKKRPSLSMGLPIKMMDMNRVPKPPKYPLYDMGSLSMATPPPPPVMHPMAQVPSNTYSTFVKAPREGRPHPPHHSRGGKPRRGPPPKKSGKHRGRRPPPPNHISRNHRKPPPGEKHTMNQGFDHPMASNLDPLVDSPPLGRPLSYDEYMERPSHSFTNDPWNFDPYAAKYNSGMNTYAMKYNYDPLGMNTLDKSQSHLDPNKLSYPGDYYTHDSSDALDSPHGVKTSQIGGWDKSPDSYRSSSPMSEMRPPHKSSSSSTSNKKYQSSNREPSRSSSQNSFNVYEDNADEASSIVQTETIHPLKLLQEANPGMEFSIESADGSDAGLGGHSSSSSNSGSSSNTGDSYHQSNQPSFYSDQLHNTEPMFTDSQWGNYPLQQQPYQSSNSYSDVSMRHDDVIFDQSSQGSHQQPSYHQQSYSTNSQPVNNGYPHQTSPSRHDYENAPSSYTYDDDAQMNNRKQDYVRHNTPNYNLSDHYSPSSGDLTTDLLPPNENAQLYKRTGVRKTRHESTPMVELEGLSLLKDILHSENALAARQQLFRVL